MSDLQIPVGTYGRRIFWVIVAGLILLAVLGRIVVVPLIGGTDAPSAASLIDDSLGDLVSTIIVAVVLSALVLFFISPTKDRLELDVIHPKDLSRLFKKTLGEARSWEYNGSTGRWNRAVALPALASDARESSSTRSCRLIIMDPDNHDLCQAYADYRSGLRTGKGNQWSARTVKQEICASIVLAAMYSQREGQLEVSLFVKSSSPIFRIDASDKRVILTREDPNEPGLSCSAETHFFDSFLAQVNFDVKQSREVDLSGGPITGAAPTPEVIRQVLATAGLSMSELSEGDFINGIVEIVDGPKNPYGG